MQMDIATHTRSHYHVQKFPIIMLAKNTTFNAFVIKWDLPFPDIFGTPLWPGTGDFEGVVGELVPAGPEDT